MQWLGWARAAAGGCAREDQEVEREKNHADEGGEPFDGPELRVQQLSQQAFAAAGRPACCWPPPHAVRAAGCARRHVLSNAETDLSRWLRA
jgi:hypothetical protein